MVITAQCTATFSRSIVLLQIKVLLDVNMSIKFWSEADFFRLGVL
jgi:hypothetical protein